jgi:HSP20 family protein
MSTKALTKTNELFPSLYKDFFRPWNEWFDDDFSNLMTMPAVNITENKNEYNVSLAAPGMKKDDFKIDMDGNLLTISSETKQEKETKEEKYTRKEFNYSSFSRTFTIPDEINKEKIDAHYENGILRLVLPKKEEARKNLTKSIQVK